MEPDQSQVVRRESLHTDEPTNIRTWVRVNDVARRLSGVAAKALGSLDPPATASFCTSWPACAAPARASPAFQRAAAVLAERESGGGRGRRVRLLPKQKNDLREPYTVFSTNRFPASLVAMSATASAVRS